MLRRSENNGDYYSSKDRQILVVNVVQTSDLSWEFLKIENKQLENKLSRTFLVDKTGVELTTHFCVEVINIKRQLKGKLGHVVQLRVCRLV